MKTVLVNKNTQQLLSEKTYPGGYNAVFPHGKLPENVEEYEQIDTIAPQFDGNTEYLTFEYLLDNTTKQRVLTWHKHTRNPIDIKKEQWQHIGYQFRIKAPRLAPDGLGSVYAEIKAHSDLNDLPIKKEGDWAYIYCNEVLAGHQHLLDTYPQHFSKEDRDIFINS